VATLNWLNEHPSEQGLCFIWLVRVHRLPWPGCGPVLAKPFTVNDLQNAVSQALGTSN